MSMNHSRLDLVFGRIGWMEQDWKQEYQEQDMHPKGDN